MSEPIEIVVVPDEALTAEAQAILRRRLTTTSSPSTGAMILSGAGFGVVSILLFEVLLGIDIGAPHMVAALYGAGAALLLWHWTSRRANRALRKEFIDKASRDAPRMVADEAGLTFTNSGGTQRFDWDEVEAVLPARRNGTLIDLRNQITPIPDAALGPLDPDEFRQRLTDWKAAAR